MVGRVLVLVRDKKRSMYHLPSLALPDTIHYYIMASAVWLNETTTCLKTPLVFGAVTRKDLIGLPGIQTDLTQCASELG